MTLALRIFAALAGDFLLGVLVGMAIGRRDRASREQRRVQVMAAHPAGGRDRAAWKQIVDAERRATVTRIGRW